MTQHPFDQLAKQYLEEMLTPLGQVQRNFEVPGEAKYVDVWFTPTPGASAIAAEDLLNRLAQTASLFEPFHNPPSRSEVRACLLKLFWLQEELRRRNPSAERALTEADLPRLWVIASTVSSPLLAELGAVERPEWLSGMYFAPDFYKSAFILTDQLPKTTETLGIRILGRGATQQAAIKEVKALAVNDPRRDRILRILANWKVTLELSESLITEDQEIIMALTQAYLEWEQTTERRVKVSLILKQLNARLGELAPVFVNEIEQLPTEQLDVLAVALLDFASDRDLEQWLGSVLKL